MHFVQKKTLYLRISLENYRFHPKMKQKEKRSVLDRFSFCYYYFLIQLFTTRFQNNPENCYQKYCCYFREVHANQF
jgi:hypothetical protein